MRHPLTKPDIFSNFFEARFAPAELAEY